MGERSQRLQERARSPVRGLETPCWENVRLILQTSCLPCFSRGRGPIDKVFYPFMDYFQNPKDGNWKMRLIFSYVLVRCESYGGGPRSFQHPGLVSWKTIFHEPGFGVGEWFQASSVLNLLCTLLIFLLSQLHFRSSCTSSQRLGTPDSRHYFIF